MQVKQEVNDGVQTHLVAVTRAGKVEFDGYYLRNSVYEESARQGGLFGPVSWRPVAVPHEGCDDQQGEADGEWATYLTVPHFAIFVVAK